MAEKIDIERLVYEFMLDFDDCFSPSHRTAMQSKLVALVNRAVAEAQREQREAVCWHCKVVLAYAPRLRCEDCPTECDIEECDAEGCS